jgi:hypothetical protein
LDQPVIPAGWKAAAHLVRIAHLFGRHTFHAR